MNSQLLIVGLGNPGDQYKNTRHNIGFMILDELAKELNFSFKEHKGCEYQKLKFDDDFRLHFLKPMEYMNLSGNLVAVISNLYKIPVNNILVVHDEIDFVFGKLKLKFGGGHAGHNGLKSIIEKLGSNEFYRLRFGVGRPENPQVEISDFVLGNFTETEKLQLPKLMQTAKEKIQTWIRESQRKLKSS